MQEKAVSEAKNDGKEICGLLVDNGYYVDLIQVKNKIERGSSFAFYVNEIRAIQKAVSTLNYEIIGTFHSHPVGLAEPGKSDIENTHNDSYMIIFGVMEKEIELWYIDKNYKTIKDKMNIIDDKSGKTKTL